MKDNPKKFVLIAPMAAALLMAVLPNSARSQAAAAGTLTGTLTDTSGVVVPDAQVIVHNEDTGAEREVSTNGAGIYVAAFLQPGRYEVSATKAGFVKVIRKGLTLQVGQILTIDLELSLQTTQETVAVTAEAPVVDVEKTEVSQVVSENMVENLPLVGRRWDNFVLLTPAVTTDGNSVSFRGISSLYNNNSVDAANNNQAFFSTPRGGSMVPYVYSLDSIQEFQVSAANYSAEFGHAAGGVVNAITRSGGNDITATCSIICVTLLSTRLIPSPKPVAFMSTAFGAGILIPEAKLRKMTPLGGRMGLAASGQVAPVGVFVGQFPQQRSHQLRKAA